MQKLLGGGGGSAPRSTWNFNKGGSAPWAPNLDSGPFGAPLHYTTEGLASCDSAASKFTTWSLLKIKLGCLNCKTFEN
jgi:hypothetical protein